MELIEGLCILTMAANKVTLVGTVSNGNQASFIFSHE